MKSWKNSIVIHAPADQVFAYLDDPMNMAAWLPQAVEVRNVIGTGAGQQFEWTAKMAGLLLRGQSTIVEHVPNRSAVHQSIGMVSSTLAYSVEPQDDGTELTLEVEYDVPILLIGRLAENILVRRNAREFDLALVTVKETMEA
jgi:carbon monoxide dehydrogenase subunit G